MKRLCITGMALAIFSVGCGSTDSTTANDTSTAATTADTTSQLASTPPAPPTEVPAPIAARFEADVTASADNTITNTTVPLNPGWTAVGLDCQQVTAIDPGGGVAGVASFNGTSYNVDGLSLASLNRDQGGRRGLFVYSSTASNLTYAGQDDGQGDSVTLHTGWNLVSFNLNGQMPCSGLGVGEPPPVASPGGSPFTQASPRVEGSPRSQPSPDGLPRVQPSPGAAASPRNLGEVILPTLYELAPNGQTTPVRVDTGMLNPGRAYWVYCSGPATVTRPHQPRPGASPGANPGAPPTSSPASSPTSSPRPSPSPTPTPSPSPSPTASPRSSPQ